MEEKEIGKKLLYLRKKASLSQVEVAKELGVTRQTLSKWETGKSYPDAVFIKKFSLIYNISADELLSNSCNLTNEDETITDASKKKDNTNRLKIWLLLGTVDFLLCFVLVYISRQMLFWVLNFNCILLAIILLVRLIYFFKDNMK